MSPRVPSIARGRLAPLLLLFLVLCGGIGLGLTLRAAEALSDPVAVIFDQIALDDPRSDFAVGARDTLEAAGYALNHIGPGEASVRRFARLPRERPELLILRTHAALVVEDGRWTEDVALFTAQEIDLRALHLTGLPNGVRLHPASPHGAGAVDPPFSADELATLVPVQRTGGARPHPLYGVGARFVHEKLEGHFEDTVVVLMGCDGMRGRAISEAFLARGARAVIGWSDEVSAAHTDRATLALLRRLAGGTTVAEAVRVAMAEAGPDPHSGAYLIAAVQ